MTTLPVQVEWPVDAVTFLVLGGQDYFKGAFTTQQYLASTVSQVPRHNTTTAILLVNEMQHMPQADLLQAMLHHLVSAAVSWKRSPQVLREELDALLGALVCLGVSGRLQYTTSAAVWEGFAFDRRGVSRC